MSTVAVKVASELLICGALRVMISVEAAVRDK